MTIETPNPYRRIIVIAVALTTSAENAYFTVWGLFLFPEGKISGKRVWTITCSIAMGLVTGKIMRRGTPLHVGAPIRPGPAVDLRE